MGKQMEQAVKDAIRAGGISTLSYAQQILVARALIILSHWPDDDEKTNRLGTKPNG